MGPCAVPGASVVRCDGFAFHTPLVHLALFAPYGWGTATPGTVITRVRRKLRLRSLSRSSRGLFRKHPVEELARSMR
jgi:hypothetical protein